MNTHDKSPFNGRVTGEGRDDVGDEDDDTGEASRLVPK